MMDDHRVAESNGFGFFQGVVTEGFIFFLLEIMDANGWGSGRRSGD